MMTDPHKLRALKSVMHTLVSYIRLQSYPLMFYIIYVCLYLNYIIYNPLKGD